MKYPRVNGLRARLARTGDVATPSTEGLLYDAALEEGVRRFQARHGLEPDGVVGPATLRAWLDLAEAWRITQALRACKGNRSAAARMLARLEGGED